MPTYITNRNMTYNTRALKAGDEFQTSRRDGDLLVRLGKAQAVPSALAVTGKKPAAKFTPPAPPVVAPVEIVTPESEASDDTLAIARDDYEQIVGKRWFHGWDEAELRKKIAAHQAGNES